MSRVAVGNWEKGKDNPRPHNLASVAEVYDLDVNYLATLLPPGERAIFHASAKEPSANDEEKSSWVAQIKNLTPDQQSVVQAMVVQLLRSSGKH